MLKPRNPGVVVRLRPDSMSTKLQSDSKSTKQVRIDAGWHKLLRVKAAQQGTTIKALLDEIFSEALSPKEADKQELKS